MTNTRTYVLISPTGKKYRVENLAAFARRFPNLNRRGLSKLVTGDQESHKNWRLA
jgi:hypothetical protein